jgi:predicted lipoprotein with Yx(FWY)xxD motif
LIVRQAQVFGLAFFALTTALSCTGAFAQPADLPIPPASAEPLPADVKVSKLPSGAVYTNKGGLTLYGLDMRTLMRAGPDPALYCKDACAQDWEPMLAPKDAKPNIRYPRNNRPDEAPPGFVRPAQAPDWSIVDGAAGPQYVYKGWHLVFVRKGDIRGSTAFEGAENRSWNTLKYIPPVPQIVAPGNVAATFFEGAFALADTKGRLLFTGKCSGLCADWLPFSGGMASAGIGEWRVDANGDMPQWTYRTRPVFVVTDGQSIPKGGEVLRP